MDLKGRVTLITGATDGVGRALAERMAAEGAALALVSNDGEALTKLAGDIGAMPLRADVTDRDQVAGLLGLVQRTLGPVDVLVNVATALKARFVAAFTQAELYEVVATDLLAPMQLCGQAVPEMVARGQGHIVNISSAAGALVLPGLSPHAAAKAGLSHYTAGLRAELRGTGVRTTLVELGPVRSDQQDDVASYPPARAALARLGRLGLARPTRPEDVADVVFDALRRDRTHVRHPRGVALASVCAEIPRWLSEWLLVPRRSPEPPGSGQV